ncbi:hypothetical protein SAMN05421504_104351 [Amycolatopsis xylanica]|uniref:IrrE N-terminal-like domain-containing protein n=1 Tax=Amycolatopsis xylanica TaxID=589385 RepID=A0A1H3GPR0_9PSEU|nr:hypothetical protein [Amycolatopsis xylanica]SDY05281.1 hypothetical protein SAMN05421504_104351 [Amycolatopsis xylanica]
MTEKLTRQGIRARCTKLLRELGLRRTFTTEQLIGKLAESRGRPIHLDPVRFPSPGPCGLWVATDQADYILYEADTSKPHQEHIIVHELAHMVCGHHAHEKTQLFPDVAPELVRAVLARKGYSETHEREAELMASFLLGRVEPEPDRPEPSRAVAALDRILRPPT